MSLCKIHDGIHGLSTNKENLKMNHLYRPFDDLVEFLHKINAIGAGTCYGAKISHLMDRLKEKYQREKDGPVAS